MSFGGGSEISVWSRSPLLEVAPDLELLYFFMQDVESVGRRENAYLLLCIRQPLLEPCVPQGEESNLFQQGLEAAA